MFDKTSFLATLTTKPGVYCMRDQMGKVLYVGKAKNLKHRLQSYFRENVDEKVAQLVQRIAQIDITIAPTESEALLLESSLIKSLNPRYNVIFRDDKSYPYLFISSHSYPQLIYTRGKQKRKGRYYGPYPTTPMVRGTLDLLQKTFKLRQCDDIFFNNRSRPCLQYQIGRCSAPCVGHISKDEYQADVKRVSRFLEGKDGQLIEDLIPQMDAMAAAQEYEQAARLRDQIIRLRAIATQSVVYRQDGHCDVLAVAQNHGQFCIQLLYIRQGQILDSRSFLPKQASSSDDAIVLRNFITQFYLDENYPLDFPSELIVNQPLEEQLAIEQALQARAKRKILIKVPSRGQKLQWLTIAQESAQAAIVKQLHHRQVIHHRWQDLKKVLGVTNGFDRIECFDISHTQGEATVASCVVCSSQGMQKSEYRQYNIQTVTNDDYAAMEEVLFRRYSKRKSEGLSLPEVIMVDGGKGQLHRAQKALEECQLLDITLVAIAKGEGRKPGLETLYVIHSQQDEMGTIKLPPTSQAFHLLQHIRDEAHRFAIKAHRRKRSKARQKSPLEAIPGVGPKRRQQLLNHFGGLQGLVGASVDAIACVPGISREIAHQIYQTLHEK